MRFHWKIVKIDLVTDIIASTQCGGNLLPLSTAKSSRLDWGINFQKSEHLLLKSLNPAKLRLVIFSQLIWMVLFSSTRDISEKHFRYQFFKKYLKRFVGSLVVWCPIWALTNTLLTVLSFLTGTTCFGPLRITLRTALMSCLETSCKKWWKRCKGRLQRGGWLTTLSRGQTTWDQFKEGNCVEQKTSSSR